MPFFVITRTYGAFTTSVSTAKASFASRESAETAARAATSFVRDAYRREGAVESPFDVLVVEADDLIKAGRLARDEAPSPAISERVRELEDQLLHR